VANAIRPAGGAPAEPGVANAVRLAKGAAAPDAQPAVLVTPGTGDERGVGG
jgi:hypothetical protein